MRSRTALAYTAAAFTLAIAASVPFVLTGAFMQMVAHAGLRIDPAYSGGTVARVVDRNGYRILIGPPVYPRALQRIDPFVQIAFGPASALPHQVSEDLDLDGDGQADVHVSFTVPADPHTRPQGSVIALSPDYGSFVMPGEFSFSQLIVQADGAVVIRVPLRRRRPAERKTAQQK